MAAKKCEGSVASACQYYDFCCINRLTSFIKMELPKWIDCSRGVIFLLLLLCLLFHTVQLLDLYVFHTSSFRQNVATKWKKWEVKRWENKGMSTAGPGSGKNCDRTGLLHPADEDTVWGKAWKFKLANSLLDIMHTFLTVRSVVAVTSVGYEISAVAQSFQVGVTGRNVGRLEE